MSEKKHLRVYIPRIIGGLLAALAIFYVVKIIMDFIDKKPAKSEKKIQPITLMKPPPPPPPPPKVEKPPEPEIKEKIEEPEPEPEPMPESPPDEAPPRDLGLDAEGTAGSDGFGLAARKGGTGLFGGGTGNPYAWYGGLVKNGILNLLSSHEELRRKGYTAIVKVWLKADGSVERVELAKGSNDADIDELLGRLLNKFDRVAEAPPPGMQQPIKLKISSRI
ncbi:MULTISPECIES: energy transducer TonB [Methylomonas]|uniref:TonB-dependent receptor n=2 Tax=Methylomonas TaxID=416 RepID=A0A126T973_9GAMM|nr:MULTISPECIES: TonB C-terminal domain-containing protein [Methylomonas]AMK78344.1 TonB-dependent receptor [Methylomonas denitrificans]OAI04057.1 TonB-dependent receptor [Methylomonas methanica]TCV87624.1 outer membrane transport energization protein TonB [Methylomonas methanica]